MEGWEELMSDFLFTACVCLSVVASTALTVSAATAHVTTRTGPKAASGGGGEVEGGEAPQLDQKKILVHHTCIYCTHIQWSTVSKLM